MAAPRLPDSVLLDTIALLRKHGDTPTAADFAKIPRPTMQRRVEMARDRFPDAIPPSCKTPGWAFSSEAYHPPSETARAPGSPPHLPNAIERRLSARGDVGGPPIPEIARPPEGFMISRNSGVYDADGKLLRQFVQSRRDAGEVYEVPAGHVVKGESAFVDADGRTLAKWVKTTAGGTNGIIDGLLEVFAAFDGAAPLLPAPMSVDDDLLTVYPLPDLHLGMYSWDAETGANYDVEIAVAMATQAIQTLVEQSRPSRKAVILVLGDYFHGNDAKNATPGSGHVLDVDTRWPRVFAAGAKLAVRLVELVAQKHLEVEVKFLPGNHDPDASMCMTVALSLFFSSNPQIEVNQDPGIAWYRRFGAVLLGATHGHTMKPDKMAMMLATDRAQDWGLSRHRHVFFGHIHHETVKEIGSVRVESFSSPAARDAWNAAGGYRSGRALSAITFHAEDGEIGRHRVTLGEVKPR